MSAEGEAFAAIDLGASSGRVVTGRLDGGRMDAHRGGAPLPNRPVRLPDGLRWNLLHLFTEALEGLRSRRPAARRGHRRLGGRLALLDGGHGCSGCVR